MNGGSRIPVPHLLAVILVVLLVVLGTLQYVWIGRISRAERERLQTGLLESATRFTEGFDRELIRMAVTFTPAEHRIRGDVEEWLRDRLEWWRAEAPFPGLVARLALVRRTGEGLVIRCVQGADEGLQPCTLPPPFAALEGELAAGRHLPPLPEGIGGLVLAPRRRGDPARPGPESGPAMVVLVELDLAYAVDVALPQLALSAFGDAGAHDFTAVVVPSRDPDRELARFGDGIAGLHPERADLVRPFFPIRPLLPSQVRGRMLPGRSGETAGEERESGSEVSPGEFARAAEVGRWLLLVAHRAGSLELAISQTRRRNLALGLSVLALLAASSFLLAVSSQRAQRLARQQLRFVAGVSHELRTPLTAITTAGQNLADGVVADPGQVRRYGAMIQQEGQRLAQLVGRVLTFAGIRSGQRVYALEPTVVADLVSEVLADARLLLEGRGFTVDVDVPPDLPPVWGDPGALREALGNLVDNAVKFSGEARWLGVSAVATAGGSGGEVALTVADRGPGIPRSDMPRIFEPFVRGSTVSVPGSGLGLSVVKHVVESHGGRIGLSSTPGKGTAVTLHLPTVPPSGNAP